jgi:SAM-dependent methyltransferase
MIFDKWIGPFLKNNIKLLEIGPDEKKSYQQKIEELKLNVDYFFGDVTNCNSEKKGFIKFIDEEHIECDDAAFDLVLNAQVIEHVRKPWLWVKELARVLKVGGWLIIVAPMTWCIHHTFDCWRIFPDGMITLLKEAKLHPTLIQVENLCGEIDKERQLGQGLCYDIIGIGQKLE